MASPTENPPPPLNGWVSDIETPPLRRFASRLWLGILALCFITGTLLLILPTAHTPTQKLDASGYEASQKNKITSAKVIARMTKDGTALLQAFTAATSLDTRLTMITHRKRVEPLLRAFHADYPNVLDSPIKYSALIFEIPWAAHGETYAKRGLFGISLTNLNETLPELESDTGRLYVPVDFHSNPPKIDAEFFYCYYSHLFYWFTEKPRQQQLEAKVTAQRIAPMDDRASQSGWVALRLRGSSIKIWTPTVVMRESSPVWQQLSPLISWDDATPIHVELSWTHENGKTELTISRIISTEWSHPYEELLDEAKQAYLDSLQFEAP